MIQDGDPGEVDQHEPHQKVIFLFIVDHITYIRYVKARVPIPERMLMKV